ncbi:MAG: DUF4249 domain-containing protein [Bacteroidales bacterium]|nr:DUF4249 domain-containing protein [Bacteroidales bacterium]
MKNIEFRAMAHTIKRLMFFGVLVILLFHIPGCQLPYTADIDETYGSLSVEASLVKGDSVQTVIISRSSSLYNPEFDPVADCEVSIEDEEGNTYKFEEENNGLYSCVILDELMVIGRNYRLKIATPDDKVYESNYEKLIKGVPVDSVYYEPEMQFSVANDKDVKGLQFYLDLVGSESDSRYYRWVLTETWEYHSISPISFIYLVDTLSAEYPDDPWEYFFCWKCDKVPGLYSSSTVDLSINLKKKIPLNFVSNQSNRLKKTYSLLVEQFALSKEAYAYWNQTKIETLESGELHTQQPGQTGSNIYNVTNDAEKVLGFFWAANKTEKRIFVQHPDNMNFPKASCELVLFSIEDAGFPPFYIFADEIGTQYTSADQCLNCLLLGGDNKKPDYWPY